MSTTSNECMSREMRPLFVGFVDGRNSGTAGPR